MGNRAVITDKERTIGIYLHWNGGRPCVEAFLEYCRRTGQGCGLGYASSDYSLSLLIQVIRNALGGSVGVYPNPNADIDDNGLYEVEGWDIVGRYTTKWEGDECKEIPFPSNWEESAEGTMSEYLHWIDEKQPEQLRLGELVDAELVLVEDLKLGDEVYVNTCEGMKKFEIIGYGEDKTVNGYNRLGQPMINQCCNGSPDNPNNYLGNYEKKYYRVSRSAE